MKMGQEHNSQTITKDRISSGIVEILQDLTMDWDLEFDGAINSETGLVEDLGFESIDIVEFVVGTEEHFKRRGLPFEELLMVDGRYVDDIKVQDAVDFLYRHLNSQL